MKIGFAIPGKPNEIVYTWSDLERCGNGDGVFFSKEFYLKIKCLERNDKFASEIKQARKRLGLPEDGLSISQVTKKLHIKDLFDYPIKLTDSERNELRNINKKFNFDLMICSQIRVLIQGNFVFRDDFTDEGKKITHTLFEDDIDQLTIDIKIPVSRNLLYKYIEDNWPDIEKKFGKMRKKSIFSISERNLEIYDLKNNNPDLSFEDIADKVIEKYKIDDPEGHLNGGSAKTAYRRVVEKIDNLAKYKK